MVAIGCDHAGFPLKSALIEVLERRAIAYEDFGCQGERIDYVEPALDVAQAVVQRRCELGILICGTGIGMSICANKVPGIRAAVCGDVYSARMTRAHNDANVLAIGARVIGEGLAADIVETFLTTPFEGGRHLSRVQKIHAVEQRFAGM